MTKVQLEHKKEVISLFKEDMDYWVKLLNQPNLSEQTIEMINRSMQMCINLYMMPKIIIQQPDGGGGEK